MATHINMDIHLGSFKFQTKQKLFIKNGIFWVILPYSAEKRTLDQFLIYLFHFSPQWYYSCRDYPFLLTCSHLYYLNYVVHPLSNIERWIKAVLSIPVGVCIINTFVVILTSGKSLNLSCIRTVGGPVKNESKYYRIANEAHGIRIRG